METKFAIGSARDIINENVDLRSAVHRAFAIETSPAIMTFMVAFPGQTVCPIFVSL